MSDEDKTSRFTNTAIRIKRLVSTQKRYKWILNLAIVANLIIISMIYFQSIDTHRDLNPDNTQISQQTLSKRQQTKQFIQAKKMEKTVKQAQKNQSRRQAVVEAKIKKEMTAEEQRIREEKINEIEKRVFLKKTAITPFVPSGYKPQYLKSVHPKVNAIEAEHPTKIVKISTLVTTVAFDKDDLDLAARRLLNNSIDDLEPVENPGLEHKNLENIKVYLVDDESPVYAVIADVKGHKVKKVMFGVSGKAEDVKSELPMIKEEFKKLEIK